LLVIRRWVAVWLGLGLACFVTEGQTASGIRSAKPFLYVPKAERSDSRAAVGEATARFARGVQTAPRYILTVLQAEANQKPLEADLKPVGRVQAVEASALKEGQWEVLQDGAAVWRLALVVPGAASLRVRFKDFSVRAGALRLYGADGGQVDGPYSGRGPMGDGDFWSRSLGGDTVVVEYYSTGPAAELPFAIAEVGCIGETGAGPRPAAGAARPLKTEIEDVAAGCYLDYSCFENWKEAGRPAVYIRFVQWPYIYQCTGVLVANRSGELRPYLLTAHHCISTEEAARSLEAVWFFETESCGLEPPARSSFETTSGARLIVTRGRPEGDFSLLELAALPARPVWFAGWSTEELDFGREAAVIHHPRNSYKRIAFGYRVADEPGPGGRPADRFYTIEYASGRTDFGSSGAPLFYRKNGAFFLAGILSYGDTPPPGLTVCDLSPFRDGYGRFSIMYPVLAEWLDPPQQPGSLRVSPDSIDFQIRGQWSFPEAARVRLANTAAGPVEFRLESGASWLLAAPQSGVIDGEGTAEIEVRLDPQAFSAPGEFQSVVLVHAVDSRFPPLAVSVRVNVLGPRITLESFRNAADWAPGIVAGSLAVVLGTGLARGLEGCITAASPGGPWPLELGGVKVQFGSHPAPIFSVCNVEGLEFAAVQVPFELAPGTVWARVEAAGEWALLNGVPVREAQPGIFETFTNGERHAVVTRMDGSLVTPAQPLRAGESAVLYATGLGPVLPLVATNQAGFDNRAYYRVAIRIAEKDIWWPLAAEYASGHTGVFKVTFQAPVDAKHTGPVSLELAVQPGDDRFWIFSRPSAIWFSP